MSTEAFYHTIYFIRLQVLLEMSPGMGVDKYVYSSSDLKSHNARPHTWGPADLVRKLMSDQGFDAVLENPTSGALETLSQLVCFGSTEVSVYNKTLIFRF